MKKEQFEILMYALYGNNQLFIPQGQAIQEWIDNAFDNAMNQEQLTLSGVLASAEFKEIINQAIKDGVSTDWYYDEKKGEYPVNTFDDNVATKSVIEALNKHLL
mgnify:CR=1 FL=1